ncbi:hypothetical protein JNUCC1_00911 [Lentibacillus sp. JNUCC-1]|nr:hypothetical protein [Lentibacillus sp. JNUCC-1]
MGTVLALPFFDKIREVTVTSRILFQVIIFLFFLG